MQLPPNDSSEIHHYSPSNQRRKFSPEEDIQLNRIISIYGPRKWDQIALSLPGRTGRQCRDRFQNYLKPSLTNGPWTRDEDQLLEQKVCELGQHWNKIAKFFIGRSSNNIKNRFYTYIYKKKKCNSLKLNRNRSIEDVGGQLIGEKLNFCKDLMDDNYLKKKFDNHIKGDLNWNVDNGHLKNGDLKELNIGVDDNDLKKNDVHIYCTDSINPILFLNKNKGNLIESNSNFEYDHKNEKFTNSNSKNSGKIFFPPISIPDSEFILPSKRGLFSFLSREIE